ncbi:MAG: uncharacterized protein JWL70_467 [Acidimicrobiia bacterium]|nr:uncharacterized protein [Acidimicrobiia bacterium]
MTMTATAVDEIKPIGRAEARTLAATENARLLDLLQSLHDTDWSTPTVCSPWDVRAMAGHVLGGMEGFASVGALMHIMRSAKKEAGDGSFVDAMTAIQVRERAGLSGDELLARMGRAGPRSARFRNRIPAPLRNVAMKQELLSGAIEKWKLGYLVDVILTRDTWMHRTDIAVATARPLTLTADHDGRIVADAVAEWARRHGQPFTLELSGPAGGSFTGHGGGEALALDAVEFCRVLSGRGVATGLLAQEVPF